MDYSMPWAPSEEEDYQAKDALRTLIQAEDIKCYGEQDFIDRIREQVERQMELLQMVKDNLPGMASEMYSEMEMDDNSGDPANGTRRYEDFLDRIRKKEAENNRLMFEDPKDRKAKRKYLHMLKNA